MMQNVKGTLFQTFENCMKLKNAYIPYGVTVIDAKGGYSKNKKKMLLCVIPTSEYFVLKEVVLTIDKNAFFTVIDAYEVMGGE